MWRKGGKGVLGGEKDETGLSVESLLFNILIADLEEEMDRVKREGVKLEEVRIYSLSYAHMLLAEDEGKYEKHAREAGNVPRQKKFRV